MLCDAIVSHLNFYPAYGCHNASSGRVLIDDRECAREPWENAGGVFIHHVDAETTLQRLRERGIL